MKLSDVSFQRVGQTLELFIGSQFHARDTATEIALSEITLPGDFAITLSPSLSWFSFMPCC